MCLGTYLQGQSPLQGEEEDVIGKHRGIHWPRIHPLRERTFEGTGPARGTVNNLAAVEGKKKNSGFHQSLRKGRLKEKRIVGGLRFK